MQYSNSEWNYNLKRSRELHECKDSPVKSTILVPVYVRVVFFLFICSNNNKRLDTVINNSVLNIIRHNKISNKLLVNETSLRFLLPDQWKNITPRYKQMCGCECCIIIKQ